MVRVFITGSTDGIGQAAAKLLAEQGHQVVLHARNADRAASAKAAIPNAAAILVGNLSSIEETKKLAKDANNAGPFDVVVHNAGIGYGSTASREITSDKISAVFAVNTLAPYILTCLMDKPKSRLLFMSSDSHYSGDETLKNATQSHSYGNTKLHDTMLAKAFARRWADIQVLSMHPGWVKTKMGGSSAPVQLSEPAKALASWVAGEGSLTKVTSDRLSPSARPQTDRPAILARPTDRTDRSVWVVWVGLGWPKWPTVSVPLLAHCALGNKVKAKVKVCLLNLARPHLLENCCKYSRRAPYMCFHTHIMKPSSRTSSPVPSIPQSLASYLPPTSTDTTPEATVDDAPQCEFDIDWENIWHCGKRLVGVKKRPRHRRVVGTKMKESWIYRHGANLEHKGVRYWLCRLCHEKRSYSTALYASSGTAHAARHLLRQHQIAEFGDSSPSLTTPFTLAAASASSSVRPLSRQASLGFQLGSHFDERSWKARFVDWIILEDVTFRQASSERLRWLIANGGELASQLLPEHHTTVCSWIRLTFESRRQIIFNLVKDAKSSVHLSFDLWTASNGFHYIGIVGHFVDSEGEKRDVLLGLPRLVGPHSGENMASYVKEVINQYEMGSKLGYFMLDNAESNDTCLETLARWFPMDVSRRRLRCIGHIINLVVRAVIFGSNVSKFEAELRGATDEFSFEIWAKKGAVGRLHNLATYIRRTDQRRQALRRLQTELAGDDAIFTLEIVVDGKTRWNSIYVMIKRGMRICLSLTSVEHLLTWDRLILALELRSAIELYQSRWQKPKNDPVHRDLTKDFLSAVDWAELERFHDFLKPFYILTKTMEGNASKPGAEGGHGAVWETLKTMDYLFVKFKQAAEETQFEEPSHFKSGIDCGWAKLEDYYIKTDRTPIYRAALALHPSYGYDYFERHWKNAMDRPQWYSDMQSAVGSLFDEYVRQAEVETQAQAGLLEDEADEIEADVNDYSSFGKRSIRSLHTQRKKVKAVSDLDLFQTRPIYPQDLDVANPLEWWNRHQLEYPVLYRMALDLFSIPGMSADCERVFSQTKKMITDERNRLAPEVVEADQLQKHWLMRGLVV
ncbi:putative oxidoreductase [Fusarium oxysporum f. sp. matthiolae]|nr:putative oxidoreductase [Fusarium oxysporum f. sp. matthiolae]